MSQTKIDFSYPLLLQMNNQYSNLEGEQFVASVKKWSSVGGEFKEGCLCKNHPVQEEAETVSGGQSGFHRYQKT